MAEMPLAPDEAIADSQSRDAPAPQARGWWLWAGKGAFEAVLIVFSVLLALTLDGWREESAQHRRFAEAVASLADEVTLNRELLSGTFYVEHHRRLLGHYQQRADAGSSEGANEAFKNGLHPAPLRDTAWASLGQSGVSHLLPFALRAELAGLYRDQTSLDDTYRTLMGGMAQPRPDRGTEAYLQDQIRVIALFLTDIVATENRLLKQYEGMAPQLRALVR